MSSKILSITLSKGSMALSVSSYMFGNTIIASTQYPS